MFDGIIQIPALLLDKVSDGHTGRPSHANVAVRVDGMPVLQQVSNACTHCGSFFRKSIPSKSLTGTRRTSIPNSWQ